jgi:hypothetical protein
MTIPQLRNHLSKMRSDGALDTEIAVAWHQAAETLPDPSPETDLAHHQVNAMAHDLGIGGLTGSWWRHPTTLGQHTRDLGAPEPLAVQWAEEYYRGCALVCHVDGKPGAFWYRAYTVLPDFEETKKVEGEGFATLAEAYAAAMGSQIQLVDKLDLRAH